MSLMDAFLLDPLAVDVWIALRTDGAVGSGTQDDPYDGSTVNTPGPTVSSISAGNPIGQTATVATASNHGFQTGDLILIDGATENTPPSAVYSENYNGTFSITVLDPKTFTYQMLGSPSTSPAGGTITCQRDPYRFDAVMASFQNSAVALAVHLGPGIFQTKGFYPNAAGSWAPPTVGMKIFGSGIDVTTLQLVRAIIGSQRNDYFAIGGPYNLVVNAFEAADFTVDCNIAGQPSPDPTCAAVAGGGNHARLRRIRAINFGTQNNTTECFVLASGGATAVSPGSLPVQGIDCIIQDCIVEQPGLNNKAETTCLALGGDQDTGDGRMAYVIAPAIRRCFVNCEYRDHPVPVASVTISSGIATVTTILPHGHNKMDWIRISGVQLNGTTNNSYNGAYQILTVPSPTSFTYSPLPIQSLNPTGGDMWVGRWPSLPVPIVSASSTATTATIITSAPHFLAPGNVVTVNDVSQSGYIGSFPVQTAVSAYEFTYNLTKNPGAATGGFIGIDFFILTGGAGTASVVEGNCVLNSQYGGPHHDTFTTLDETIRNNYFRAVQTGPDEDLGGVASFSTTDRRIVVQLTNSGGTAIVATPYPHGLITGDLVTMAGVTGAYKDSYNGVFQVQYLTSTSFAYQPNPPTTGAPQGVPGYFTADSQKLLASLIRVVQPGGFSALATIDTALYAGHGFLPGDAVRISRTGAIPVYQGEFMITWVSGDDTQFQYQLPSDPGADAPSGYFGRVWQAHNMVMENNVFELIATPASGGYTASAIKFGNASTLLPILFTAALARRNVVRYLEGNSDAPGLPTLAVSMSGCGGLIVEENIIDLQVANPIQYAFTESSKFFSNQTPAGTLIPGYDNDSTSLQFVDEVSIDVTDAEALGVL